MTILLLVIMTIALCFLGFLLIKQTIFFALIEQNESNRKFLKNYGRLYLLLSIGCAGVIIMNQQLATLLFLAVTLLISAFFSIQFSKKMTPRG